MKNYSDVHPLAILGTPLDWGAEAFRLKMVRHLEFRDNCISLHEIPEQNELTRAYQIWFWRRCRTRLSTVYSSFAASAIACGTHLLEALTLD